VFMDSFVCSVLESRFKPESSGKPWEGFKKE
jgi:hypothetical protein